MTWDYSTHPDPQYSKPDRLDGLGEPIRHSARTAPRLVGSWLLASSLGLLALAVGIVRMVRGITTLDGSLLLIVLLVFTAALILVLTDDRAPEHTTHEKDQQ